MSISLNKLINLSQWGNWHFICSFVSILPAKKLPCFVSYFFLFTQIKNTNFLTNYLRLSFILINGGLSIITLILSFINTRSFYLCKMSTLSILISIFKTNLNYIILWQYILYWRVELEGRNFVVELLSSRTKFWLYPIAFKNQSIWILYIR